MTPKAAATLYKNGWFTASCLAYTVVYYKADKYDYMTIFFQKFKENLLFSWDWSNV